MAAEFIGRVFDGAAEPLLLHLIEESDLSLKEQTKIKRMIHKKQP